MLHDFLEKKYTFCMFIIGIAGSFLFILVGYWISGAIGISQSDNLSFFAGIGKVLNDPFARYLNNYTPIIMALAFIIFEFIFFLYLIHNRKNEPQGSDAQDNTELFQEQKNTEVDSSRENVFNNMFVEEHTEALEEIVEGVDVVFPGEEAETTINEKKSETENNQTDSTEENEPEITLDNEVVMELLGDYDMDQITAMLKVKRYINDVDADLLRKIFKVTMSSNDIAAYIEMFYE